MRQSAALTAPRAAGDWRARGRAIHQSLTTIAQSSQSALRSYLERKGVEHRAYWIVNAVRVTASEAVIEEIARRPDVSELLPDRTYSIPPPIQSIPAPGLESTDWGLESIRAPEAWSAFGALGDGIVVASIDSGVEFDHPALVRQYRGTGGPGRFDHSYNWFDPTGICGASPCDNTAHGTHTMGTIVGDDLEENQIGVAPHARWIAAKGCEDSRCSAAALLAAGQWLLAPTDANGQNPDPDRRPHVVNCSWAGESGDEFFRAMVAAWVAADIFPVFAIGNGFPECGSASSPGDYPESYGVGAYDSDGNIAGFSLRGPSAFGEIKPNATAPGVFIRSSVTPHAYDFYDGTSMAAPHVAGVVALMWSAAPALARRIEDTRVILDAAAVATTNPSCGGTAEEDNVWGEGKIDAFAAVEMSPRGPTGTLAGSVHDAQGDPIAAARIEAVSTEAARSTRTSSDGTYSLRLPVGTYDVTFSAFGFLAATSTGLTVQEDQTFRLDTTLESAARFAISGTVTDDRGSPVSGATVSFDATPLDPAVTDTNGRYSFASVPEGTYTMTARGGNCFSAASLALVVSADGTRDLTLVRRADAFGYRCAPVDFHYIEADSAHPELEGDDTITTVELPFEFMFYGRLYDELAISSNGYVSFQTTAAPYFGNTPIPSAFDPNAAIFAFWDDLVVAPGFGTVNTAVLGNAPHRRFVVEWRNLVHLGLGVFLRFELVLSEGGRILLQYRTDGDDPIQRGASASVGIENEAGDVGFEYSFQQPVLTTEQALEFTHPPMGVVRGTLSDFNDGEPLVGAEVRALQPGDRLQVVSTGDDGRYELGLPAGDFVIEVSKSDYVSQRLPIAVRDGDVLERDFSLRTGRSALVPMVLKLTVPPQQRRTRTLTLSNVGSAGFDFSLGEAGGTRAPTRPFPGNLGAHTAADTAREYFIPGFNAGGITSNLAGDGPSASDTTFDAVRGLTCRLDIASDNGIHCIDPDTSREELVIAGSFPWTRHSQRGLAHRAGDDSFYVGGWNDGVIYHVAGASHPAPGEVLSSCSPADGLISGLAWDESSSVLWVATNGTSDTIYELDPDDCRVLSSFPHPTPGGFAGAGFDLDELGNLSALSLATNSTYFVEGGAPIFNDVAWLAEEPTNGRLEAGSTAAIDVTVDTTGLSPGLYLANLFVMTTTARRPTLRVPVSLLVPDYMVAINVGGDAYTDASGDTWLADRRHTQGAFGYFQHGFVETTWQTIAGTSDQLLYGSRRVDPYAYRFDNVPNGVHEVDLRFAEFGAVRRRRIFDVIIENTVVLPAHDASYEVGTLTADPHVFRVEVADDRLDIRLVPRAGFEKPALNAIRTTHRLDLWR